MISSNANERAVDEARRAADARAAATREGNAAAQARYDELMGITAPGVRRLTDIAAAPDQLTTQQVKERDELRRRTTNALATSPLRGSGRATVAAIKDVESDYTARALASNARRADDAATRLADVNFGAVGRSAGLDVASGAASGDAAFDAGIAGAASALASGRLKGQALGDITSIIASDMKGRKSRREDDDDDEEEERV